MFEQTTMSRGISAADESEEVAAARPAVFKIVAESRHGREIQNAPTAVDENQRRKNTTPRKEKLTKLEIDAKWESYVKNRDQKTRDFLIENYLPLLNSIARHVHARLWGVDVDDLVSSGALGLMAAIDSFDPARGIRFETFCTYRIRGAIFDEVRAMDWVPRLVRSRARQLAEAEQILSNRGGRNPTDLELAEHLSVSEWTVQNIRRDDRKSVMLSLTEITSGRSNDATTGEFDALSDDGAQDVSQRILGEEFDELTRAGLSKAELLILKMYYFEEMTMSEVGKALDLSESRVSQMHSAILARLRVNPAGKTKARSTSAISIATRMSGRSAARLSADLRIAA